MDTKSSWIITSDSTVFLCFHGDSFSFLYESLLWFKKDKKNNEVCFFTWKHKCLNKQTRNFIRLVDLFICSCCDLSKRWKSLHLGKYCIFHPETCLMSVYWVALTCCYILSPEGEGVLWYCPLDSHPTMTTPFQHFSLLILPTTWATWNERWANQHTHTSTQLSTSVQEIHTKRPLLNNSLYSRQSDRNDHLPEFACSV